MKNRKLNFREHLMIRIEKYKKANLITKKPFEGEVKAADVLVFELSRGAITNNGATPWWIRATIGTASLLPQAFKFMTDTGTIDTWVTAKSCTTNECLLHSSFDETASSSFVWVDQGLDEISFGPWGTMSVNLGDDIWSLTDKNSINTEATIDFWLGQDYSGSRFGELIQDGFLACGPNGNSSRSNLLFDSLWYAGALAQPFMAYWVDYIVDGYATDKGEIIFGGGNASKYDPASIITLDIIPDIYWTHIGESIVIDGATVISSPSFIMDTGASEIKGEQAEIDTLIAAVTLNGSLPMSPDNPDNYAYPDLIINLGKTDTGATGQFVFTPRHYFNYIEEGVDKGIWQIAFTVLVGLGANTFTFGTNLLDTLYSEWEYDTTGAYVTAKSIRLANRI